MLSGADASSAVSQAANPWRVLAEMDSRASLELIERNHPAAAPSLGDIDFQQRLRRARTHVEERLPKIESYPGYDALMSGLAADFGDRHIWSTPLVRYEFRAWAGLILGRQGGAWLVRAQDRQGGEPPLLGHRLVNCDGVDAERWGRERIGLFKGNASIEAQLSRHASWLLLRDGNTFLPWPKVCTFESPTGERKTVTLNWRQAELSEIERVAGSAEPTAKAGMGVEPFGRGVWIKLETLESPAIPVVAGIEAQSALLRSAPVAVVDLRGNEGGDSAHAVSIARALVGSARIAAANRSAPDCSGAFWRASPDNLATLTAWRDRLAGGDPQSLAYVAGLVRDMEAAIAAGRAFAPDLPACASATGPGEVRQTAPLKPQRGQALVVVTDRSCFSSCLVAVDLFRRLGALHVGEATDVSTRYMEVRQEVLPSGIRTFSTLQKVALGTGDFGPYSPMIAYPGDLSRTAELQQWVASLPALSGRQ